MTENNLNNTKEIFYNCWRWFVNNRQEELFDIISVMIETKTKEVLPQIIDEQLRQKIDGISFDIQTTINGKSSAAFRDILTDMIIKEFQK